MPPQQLPPESHYDPKKLDKIFAIVSVILLVSLFGIFAKDFSREWKAYQREFRNLEVEKALVKLDAQNVALGKNEDYQKIVKDLESAQKKLDGQKSTIRTINQGIAKAEAAKKLHIQQSQFAKAQYDALKYRYEAAANHKGTNAQQLKIQLDTLGAKLNNLRKQIEEDEVKVKEQTNKLKSIEQETRDLEKKRATIAKTAEIIEHKLRRIDPAQMSVANLIGDSVRDMPIIELANPNYHVKQIVLKEITEDVNFVKIPKVDRCTTCHLGIDNPDFKEAAQPYRTHPNLELYIGKTSPHPMDDFACTTCHMGRGRATGFIDAAHTPRNEEQKKLWERKYNWHELSHWEQPMLPVPYSQASCFKCHKAQENIKGAEKLNLGLNLIERAGCYGCHTIEKYNNWPKTGPSLEFLASKTSKEWAYHWIENPKAIRHNAWMPSYFNQSNNNDPASIKRNEQEILSIVAFLFKNSKEFKVDAPASTGDVAKGKELVASLGCMACHQVQPEKSKDPRNQASLLREFGPNLIGLGSKTSKEWLVGWLKDPGRYHPKSKMPNLRLSDDEASDIAAFLSEDKSPVASKPIPSVNEKILDTIVFDFMKKSDTFANTQNKIKSMTQEEKLNFAGQKLVREYGCYSCHKITGFEHEKPIGVELTEEGNKSIERLDFGFINIEHTKQAWFKQKLLNPRVYDHGKVLDPLERTKMPNFNFTDEEAQAVTTAILGFVKDQPNPSKMPNQGIKADFVNDGQRIIRQFNCQGCHIIEGEGGSIQKDVTDWLVTYKGKDPNDAKAMTLSFSPPNLVGEGKKVQAQWLYEFIHSPTPIRPWLSVRMPTYRYHAAEINTIVKYFNYLDDQEFPFTEIYHPNMNAEEQAAAEKLFSKEYFGCAQCHIVGDSLPSGSPDSWAPNFAMASKRLKPEWIIQWLTNPADLLPGTKMPTYFDPKTFDDAGPPDVLNGDEHRQIKALRDYLLSITSQGAAGQKPASHEEASAKPATK